MRYPDTKEWTMALLVQLAVVLYPGVASSQSFEISQGYLSASMQTLARSHGWSVVWSSAEDRIIDYPFTIPNASLEEALGNILAMYEGQLVADLYHGNRVVVISSAPPRSTVDISADSPGAAVAPAPETADAIVTTPAPTPPVRPAATADAPPSPAPAAAPTPDTVSDNLLPEDLYPLTLTTEPLIEVLATKDRGRAAAMLTKLEAEGYDALIYEFEWDKVRFYMLRLRVPAERTAAEMLEWFEEQGYQPRLIPAQADDR